MKTGGLTYLTSDLHLGHFNIIRYTNRPFKSLEHMNSELIRRWNERVTDTDFVIHVGDFCFRNSNDVRGEGARLRAEEYIAQLKGHKIFIKGNHDKNNSLNTKTKSLVLEYGGAEYFCVHRPDDANQEYPINFVGHCHERWTFKRYARTILINVGVDVWSFYPKTVDELLVALKQYQRNNKLDEYVPWTGGVE
jgi:calcineurin-like phosphoesterase family protein